MLTFRDLALASSAIYEREKVRSLLDQENCGISSIGEYSSPEALAPVVAAHRGWLQSRLSQIDQSLTAMGVDVASPVAWQDHMGRVRTAADPQPV